MSKAIGFTRYLEQRGLTQADLARHCGVSAVTAHQWVQGKKPLPEGRVEEVAAFLGVKVQALLRLVSTTAPRGVAAAWRPDEPVTLLDEMLRNDEMSKHLGGSWGRRVGAVAEAAGVSVGEARLWVLGRVPFPVEECKLVCRRWWPGINPVVFAPEAGHRYDEAESVRWLLDEMLGYETPETFAQLISEVEDVRRQYLEDQGVQVGNEEALLDDGREVNSYLLERGAVLAARRRAQAAQAGQGVGDDA